MPYQTPALDRDLSLSTESIHQLSQHTNCSDFLGDQDISPLIIALSTSLEGTQQTTSTEPEPPSSTTPSTTSLGKRKASDISITSTSNQSSRPSKWPRTILLDEDGENPFLDVPPPGKADVKENSHSPIVMSPSLHWQRYFDSRHLPYGVQYEIARLVTCGVLRYEDITIDDIDILAKLRSNSAAVPQVSKILIKNREDDSFEEIWKKSFAKELMAKSPWAELDKEEEVLSKSTLGGLGFNDRKEYVNWHGGQVHFRATLKDTAFKSKTPQIKLFLERAELGPSTQFGRRFGSKSLLRVKLSKTALNKNGTAMLEYLHRPVVLCGGVFRAFFAKDSNIFFIRTNEIYDGRSIISSMGLHGLSFMEFLDWHNPLQLNSSQTMAKWTSRFALGLSNSAPGLSLDVSQVTFGYDIVSKAGSDMTDGAGTINRAALRILRHHFEWEDWPTAVQVRVLGSKGLLVEDKYDMDETPRIMLRPSQIKIRYSEPDPAQTVLDILRMSHSRTPCRLSVETIINLAENGVGSHAFTTLLKQGLDEITKPLLRWEEPDAMLRLWTTLRRIGGVMTARKARENAGLARVKGYSERDVEETELEDEDGFLQADALEKRSSAWWGDEVSGCPSTLEETVMYLIDSGFTPQNCTVLREKLEKIVKSCVKNYVKSYRIDVPMSTTAFLVPDPHGILEPNEIFFKSSRRNIKTPDGIETDIVLGDVLLTRHPCKVPSDVQKLKAVDRPELHYLVDEIVCSTKGSRRAADFLAGGDYDGDKGLLIYQPELVEPFVNAPLHFANPPDGIRENFLGHNETVTEFLRRISDFTMDEKIRALQKCLLGAIRDTTVVGKYSIYHENAVYTKGYRHPDSIRLAYMFCMTLDGSKTGLTVKPEVSANDTKIFNKRAPVWKESDEDKERRMGENNINLTRPRNMAPFIMDILHQEATEEGNRRLGAIQDTFAAAGRHKVDPALIAPWNRILDLAKRWLVEENTPRLQQELEEITKHVHRIYDKHRSQISAGSPRRNLSPKKLKAAFTELPIEIRQDKFRALSREFASFPLASHSVLPEEEIARVRASYAYVYDSEQKKHSNGWTRFPWDVAMRELCAIKARATGRHKTVAGDFYDNFNIKHPHQHHV